MTSRRQFIRIATCTGAAMLASREVLAADPPMVDEKDPQAAALGYVADASRVNKAKYPNYAPGQICGNCQFYQGRAGTGAAPCTILAGKRVAEKGWCSAWAKKAA